MNCPVCKTVLTDEKICRVCKINVPAAKKIIGMSNRLYNKGLEQVKSGDLTSAVDTLRRSIYFNKNNYMARNLLGLVYYHTGLIGDAFIQWVLSSNVEKKDNPAVEYLNDSNKNSKQIEKYNNAIKMYNRAVRFIKQNNEDMAIMELKKAVSTNDNLLVAKNLLAFCYILKGNNNKALSLINDVLKIDIKNPIAINYYNKLTPKRNSVENVGIQNAPKSLRNESTNQKQKKQRRNYTPSYTGANRLIMFISGVIVSFVIMAFLVFPELVQIKSDKINELENEVELLKESYEGLRSKDTDSINSLEIENRELRTRLNLPVEQTTQPTTENIEENTTEDDITSPGGV